MAASSLEQRLAALETEVARINAQFQRHRRLRNRIGSMDLKIAPIALVRDATLLSRNLGHFRRVPGLTVED